MRFTGLPHEAHGFQVVGGLFHFGTLDAVAGEASIRCLLCSDIQRTIVFERLVEGRQCRPHASPAVGEITPGIEDGDDRVQHRQISTLAVAPLSEAAAEAARGLGYPVALKVLSRDITHKSDVSDARLGLDNEVALTRAAREMLDAVRTARPLARIDGFTVQPTVHRPHAQELIVGAGIDIVFGPAILCGQGGTAVEVVDENGAHAREWPAPNALPSCPTPRTTWPSLPRRPMRRARPRRRAWRAR
ncbi:acetate--CoA ligase family protein [Variovorax sp. PBL-E5]|uniref:acetate--CoA ligase family protein n=1 Tax=Variovorax sp. PBL-E5 TaxID=434014 RepID=UPI003FCEC934